MISTEKSRVLCEIKSCLENTNVTRLRRLDIELIQLYMPRMNPETYATAEKTIQHLKEVYL